MDSLFYACGNGDGGVDFLAIYYELVCEGDIFVELLYDC